jgi:cytochrome c biogenesis protein CcdA/glutaredoxin
MNPRRFPRTGSPRNSAGLPSLPKKTGLLFITAILLVLAVLIAPVSGIVIVEYFHQQGCAYCVKTDPVVDAIGTEYGDRIALERIEIDDRAGLRLLMAYGVTEIPVIVINRNRVLTYTGITPENLGKEIQLAESGAYPVPEEKRALFSSDPLLSVLFSFILGMMTGLSPCLLGSLVVLMAAAGRTDSTGQSGKYYPLLFGAGIVAAYLLVAAGILGAGVAFIPDSGSRRILLGMGGIIAISVGLVQAGLFSVPERVGRHVSVLVSRFHTLPGIFFAGILFAALFAPCAIAPFLVLTGSLLIDKTLMPALVLLAFASGVLAPFVAFAAFRHTAREQLLKYAGIVQKAGGLLLAGFGIWLLLSVLMP